MQHILTHPDVHFCSVGHNSKDLSTNPSLDQTKAKELVDFISWAITDGQKLAASLGLYTQDNNSIAKLLTVRLGIKPFEFRKRAISP